MTIQITIIGLQQIGASIGLALKEHTELVKRVGHDRESSVARQAEKLGAVDSISLNLPASVRQADLVILTEPIDEIMDTIKVIIQDLREGAVLMDTGPAKSGLAQWICEQLPEGRHYVSLYPAINPLYLTEQAEGIDAAHADLFKNGLIAITAPRGTNAEALKLASDLTSLLGATPLFSDEAEVDGLLAGSTILAEIASAALLNATTAQPGWREGRKLAGPEFAFATQPVESLTQGKAYGKELLLNPANSVRVIDNMIGALQDLRQAIAENDAEALQTQLEKASTAREQWLRQRQTANWAEQDNPTPRAPSSGDMLGRLIGLRRRDDKEKKDRK